MEIIARELSAGDCTEFGIIDEIVAEWTDIETFHEFIEFSISRSRQTVTLEAGEYVRIGR